MTAEGKVGEVELRRKLRVIELGTYSTEQLRGAVSKYNIPVEWLAGGERYSLISAITEWELRMEGKVLELTRVVEYLSDKPEIISIATLLKELRAQGYSHVEIDAALTRRTWG